jgi:hypothetical protein
VGRADRSWRPTRTATRSTSTSLSGLCQPEPDVEEIGEQVDDLIAPVLAEFDMDTLFASSGD